jgi:hypothetical protein
MCGKSFFPGRMQLRRPNKQASTSPDYIELNRSLALGVETRVSPLHDELLASSIILPFPKSIAKGYMKRILKCLGDF